MAAKHRLSRLQRGPTATKFAPNTDLLTFCVSANSASANTREKTAPGTFHVGCRIAHIVDRRKGVEVPKLLVDTGGEYTWVPKALVESIGIKREKKDLQFVMANGQQITRSVGFAVIHVADTFTVDEIVFAEEGDLALLRARSLEGLNLTVDPRRKRLLASGPLGVA